MTPGATLLLLLCRPAIVAPPDAPAGLIEAVVAWLLADEDLAEALAGGVWSDEVPARLDDGTPVPYPVAAIVEDDDVPEYESDGLLTRQAAFNVSTFALGKAEARALGRLVRAALADAPLEFGDGELLRLMPRGSRCTKDPEPGPAGADVWHRVDRFEATVASTTP